MTRTRCLTDKALASIDERAAKRFQANLSITERLCAVATDETMHQLGDFIDSVTTTPDQLGGRPRHHAGWELFLFGISVQLYGSARAAERELHASWAHIIAACRAAFPSHCSMWPQPVPPTRAEWQYAKKRYKFEADGLNQIICWDGVRRAGAMGLLQSDGPGSLSQVVPERTLYGDGTVIATRFRGPKRDRNGRLRRHDPDQRLHVEGGGRAVRGVKLNLLNARGAHENQEVTFGVGLVSATGQEVPVMMRMLDELLPSVTGTLAVAYDGAFKGKHIAELLKRGVLVAVKPDSDQVEKVIPIGEQRVVGGRKRTVDVVARNGHPHVKVIAADGTSTLEPLVLQKRLKRPSRKPGGDSAFYAVYELPQATGGGAVTLRLDTTEQDKKAKFNRSHHLRPITSENADWHDAHGRRPPAESRNNSFKNYLDIHRRAHSVGALAIQLDALLHVFAQNVHNSTVHARRQQLAA